MSETINTISRNELYELVWTHPITELAKRFDVWGSVITKACERHRIPRPIAGYWARRQHGKTTPKPVLPQNDDPKLEKVVFIPRNRAEQNATPAPAKQIHELMVEDSLTSPHPLIVATKRYMQSKAPGVNRIIIGASDSTLDVNVSRDALNRALRIMDAVLKYWDKLGGTVCICQREWNSTAYTALKKNDDEVGISIEERTERGPHKQAQHWYERRQYTSRPSGKLAFKVWGASWDKLRETWADGSCQRIENVLSSLMQGILDHIVRIRFRRLDNEAEEQQKKLVKERRNWIKRAHNNESNRRKQIIHMIKQWRTANRIRELISAVRNQSATSITNVPTNMTDPHWQKWALWYADHLDPTINAADCPINEGPGGPVNTPLDQLPFTHEARSVLTDMRIGDTDMMYQLLKEDAEKCKRDAHKTWREAQCLLEGLGYDVTCSD